MIAPDSRVFFTKPVSERTEASGTYLGPDSPDGAP
jgi:hypothetical protein